MRDLYKRLASESTPAEIQSALVEVLPVMSSPEDWSKIFSSQSETEQFLSYLIGNQTAETKATTYGVESASEIV